MVFQSFNLFPHRTALGNVIEGPIAAKESPTPTPPESAKTCSPRSALGDKRDVYPNRLSGGHQQRAAIASTLALNPHVTPFDEPTSTLDPELIGEVLGVIRSLAEEGMTMLAVTHELGFTLDAADRIICMDARSLVEQGRPKDLTHAPQDKGLQRFLGAMSTP